ncbi:MAG: cell division protein FtsQ/DivIB [Burkholderiales bacterium]|nr:cell division protein FtsQ/DivIB [Burkholderiales bacterium]
MWSNWRLLDAIASGLFLAAAAIAGYSLVAAVLASPSFPLKVVRVAGALEHVPSEAIRERLAGHVTGNFFGADLDMVRGAIESIPWVRRAAVRREWPDRILVRIEEQVPVARWSDHRLVNTHGELFVADAGHALPELAGPPGAEREVVSRYAAFSALVAPIGSALAELALSPRRAWRLRLADGTTIEIGSDQAPDTAEARLARFVSAYPQVLAAMQGSVRHVDLRYPNGFAVRVPEPGVEAGAGTRSEGAARRMQKE